MNYFLKNVSCSRLVWKATPHTHKLHMKTRLGRVKILPELFFWHSSHKSRNISRQIFHKTMQLFLLPENHFFFETSTGSQKFACTHPSSGTTNGPLLKSTSIESTTRQIEKWRRKKCNRRCRDLIDEYIFAWKRCE